MLTSVPGSRGPAGATLMSSVSWRVLPSKDLCWNCAFASAAMWSSPSTLAFFPRRCRQLIITMPPAHSLVRSPRSSAPEPFPRTWCFFAFPYPVGCGTLNNKKLIIVSHSWAKATSRRCGSEVILPAHVSTCPNAVCEIQASRSQTPQLFPIAGKFRGVSKKSPLFYRDSMPGINLRSDKTK